jgi:hypothetical protein
MNEPSITCPQCKSEIRLTESLAAPLVRQAEDRYRKLLEDQQKRFDGEREQLRKQQEAIEQARQNLDETLRQRLAHERRAIAEEEQKRARTLLQGELDRAKQDQTGLLEQLTIARKDLATARDLEVGLRKERQALQDAKDQFELDKQRAIDEARNSIRAEAAQKAEEQAALKLLEKQKTIDDLNQKLKEAMQKAEQGSQQLQGEVLELQLEALLRTKFPRDLVEPVAKGEFGGDALQRVFGASDVACGAILWESKRTKTWSDSWLPKLREDMRAAGADLAVLVTQTLPKGVETFEHIDGVWVTSFRCAMPMCAALRQALIQVHAAKRSQEGQQTKQEKLYAYLTGTSFRNRIQAVMEHYIGLREDLDRERKALTKMWAKRQQQIEGSHEAILGMFGDLQGIAGKSIQDIEMLDLRRLGED